ncbi:3-dehydroquinate synthase [Oligoflexus tunisiensis]|uniref:3-dehydroquinate synthase n=1 Tax=Oligoflexus tunisiensis TaxID=708132 RepID=UPI000B005693|nr:3-dehydroquinate synthase family protein [Oligoflexus tunisiensis]
MSTPYQIAPLSVSWAMPDPPMPAQEYFKWPDIALGATTPLEQKLGWPGGTLRVLDEAFQRQLTRKYGWEISSKSRQAPFHMAARVFRRGVAMKDQKAEQKAGQYRIRFIKALNWNDLLPHTQLCIIDQAVAEAHDIQARPNRIFMRLDEQSKTLESVAELRVLAKKTGLHTPWTIVGGGILADTAAFAAALDGQSFRLVPTTLLSMVDACIGGKTGVNFSPYGKNQLGLFAFPQEVLIALDWLTTLPPREYLAGLAEGWKHAVLRGDPALAEKVAQLDRRTQDLHLYLRDLVAVKAEIVAQDPTEQGLRAALNLGHTLAHAIERISQDKNPADSILHGEAVGIGLLFCIDMSHTLGHLNDEAWQAMTRQLKESRIVPSPADLQRFLATDDLLNPGLMQELLVGIKQDKKNMESHASEWVLLKDWGKPLQDRGRYTITVSDDDWRRCYQSFIKNWAQ